MNEEERRTDGKISPPSLSADLGANERFEEERNSRWFRPSLLLPSSPLLPGWFWRLLSLLFPFPLLSLSLLLLLIPLFSSTAFSD